MKCESINFKFGLPVNISFNSLSQKKFFNRSFKLIWVLKGKISLAEIDFETESEEITQISAGEMKIINSFSPFALDHQEDNSKYLLFDFKNQYLKDFNSNLSKKIYSLNDNNLNELKYRAALLVKKYFTYDYQLADKIEEDLEKLLDSINNYCINNKREDDFFKKQKEDIILKVINKIETDFENDLTLKKIADTFHYNSSYLSEKFKNKTGINFKSYLDRFRLEKINYELLYTTKNINQIALESGFRNIKSFYRVFNENYERTPVEVKKKFPKIKEKILKREFEDLEWLINYINNIIKDFENKSQKEKRVFEKNIEIDFNKDARDLKAVWQKLINAGTAQSILDSNLRAQIRELQEEIEFEYLRFEGIFNDDLEVCKGDSIENIHYNWKLIDNIIDFIVENNLKPFITLSFMPDLLASKDATMFYYQANFSPPKKIEAWLDLVEAFIIHLINRYGIEQVNTWYFQIWTEFPHQGFHWAGSEEEYFDFYSLTAEKIKDISQSLKVGPASESFFEQNFISQKFLQYADKKNLPLDFYNINLYHNTVPIIDEEIDLSQFYNESTLESIKSKFKEKDYSIKIAKKIRELLNEYYPSAELIATRWNVSWNSKEYIHDTAFMADYIIDNAVKLQDVLDGLGYLNLSDLISEWPINELPFFGGRGLMNTEGIKKSGYYAYIILSELGNKIIAQGDNFIVTAKGEDIQFLIYNYAYLNRSYRNADYSIIDEYNRYQVFENKESLEFDFKFNGLNGKYKLSHYRLNRESGSAYDQWIQMGAPSDLNNHEIKYLKYKSYPDLQIKYLDLSGQYNLNSKIERNGIEFYLLRKQFQI